MVVDLPKLVGTKTYLWMDEKYIRFEGKKEVTNTTNNKAERAEVETVEDMVERRFMRKQNIPQQ
jgi:hypothetical protein